MLPRKERERELRKSLIIEAAREVFSEKGYKGTTIDDVAERAGLAKATLYTIFKNKEELYKSVLEAVFREINEIAEKAMQEKLPIREKFGLFVNRLINHFREHADFFRILMREIGKMNLDNWHGTPHAMIHEKLNKILAKELDRGRKEKEIRSIDTLRAAQIFNHMVYAYHMNDLFHEQDEKKKSDAVDFLVTVFFDGIATKRKTR